MYFMQSPFFIPSGINDVIRQFWQEIISAVFTVNVEILYMLDNYA
jgi:hypothetical protein